MQQKYRASNKQRAVYSLQRNRGKKHYWGEGKDYGFYTTPDQVQMKRKIIKFRTEKSSVLDEYREDGQLYYNPQNRYRSIERVRTESLHHDRLDMQFDDERKENEGRERKVEELEELEDNGANNDRGSNLKQKLEQYVRRNKNKQEMHLTSRNIDIKLPNISPNYQSISNGNEVPPTSKNIRESVPTNKQSKQIKQQNKSPLIAYYTRKNRGFNPTFCNSYAYPLPCYRYIN